MDPGPKELLPAQDSARGDSLGLPGTHQASRQPSFQAFEKSTLAPLFRANFLDFTCPSNMVLWEEKTFVGSVITS